MRAPRWRGAIERRRHLPSGAYAVNALDTDAEREAFEQHLASCPACDQQVRQMQGIAARLGMAASASPPAGLRERVMAALAATRQLPAEQMAGPEPIPGADSPPGRVRRRGAATRKAGRHGRSRRYGPGWVLAFGVTAIAAIFLTVSLVKSESALTRAQAQNRAIAAILAAPDARVISRRTAVGGTATVVISAARRELIVSTAGLPPLSGAKVYELWLLGPPRTRSAGLLELRSGGQAGPVLASAVQTGDSLGLTVEPAGGTTLPTTTPIVVIVLPEPRAARR
jgi:anti-sigma-K factor RskA